MGCHPNIGADKFPRQGDWLGLRTRVLFNYGPEEFLGTIVRDDAEAPHLTIIKLDDGRFVLTTECQHAPIADSAPPQSEWPEIIDV